MQHPYAHATAVPDEGVLPVDALVPGTGPCDVEVGFGRADFLLERARSEPTRRLLGLELRLKWVAQTEAKLAAEGLRNARAYAADARRALPRLEGSVETFFVHFPDPWWKRRHEKRLIVAKDMLDHFVRLLAPGGLFFVQTDVPDRAAFYRELLSSSDGLANTDPGGGFLSENPFGARSHREKKCLALGLPVYRLLFRRCATG